MNYKHALSLDPSGAFHEGKGTTGWCLIDTVTLEIIDIGTIHAADYDDMEAYWDAHIELIKTVTQDFLPEKIMIVIEDYVVYAEKAASQSYSRMETCKVIGVIQHYCWRFNIAYWMQLASEVKHRWSDSILVHKGVLQLSKGRYYTKQKQIPTNGHMRDAIRHAIHFSVFKNNHQEERKL